MRYACACDMVREWMMLLVCWSTVTLDVDDHLLVDVISATMNAKPKDK